MSDVALKAFFFRICDKSIGGTYLTLLKCFNSLGVLVCKLAIAVLISDFSLTTFILISSFYNLTIIIVWRKNVIKM